MAGICHQLPTGTVNHGTPHNISESISFSQFGACVTRENILKDPTKVAYLVLDIPEEYSTECNQSLSGDGSFLRSRWDEGDPWRSGQSQAVTTDVSLGR